MPTLYPPLDFERLDHPGNEMLSSELKQSFETAHAIHRAQRRLQEHQDPEDLRKKGVNVVEIDFDKSVNAENIDSTLTDTVHIQKKRKCEGANSTGHMKGNLDDISVFEELEARKFEAALAAAVTAESEILNLSNGIAELEAMLQRSNGYAACAEGEDEEKKHHEGETGGVFDGSIIKEGRFPTFPSMITCFKNPPTCSDGIFKPVNVDLDDG